MMSTRFVVAPRFRSSAIFSARTLIAIAFVAIALCSTAPTFAGAAGYDPAADPVADLVAASELAKAEGKNILLLVGGEWCSWCRLLARTLAQDAESRAALDAGFVTLKVNYSDENPNEEFLSRYSAISGYPHIFVLDADGEELWSKNTAELEEGKGYSRKALLDFFAEWTPKTEGE